MISQIQKSILKSIEPFINKYHIELGSINGVIFAIGIIELINLSLNKSFIFFTIGILLLIISWRIVKHKNPRDNVPTQNN